MQRHCAFPCHCLIKPIDNVSIKWSEEWTLINLWKSQMIIFVFSQILPWFPWIHDASHRPKYGLIITGWVLRHFTPLFIQAESIWLHSFSEAAEEEVIKQSLFRRSATEQTSTDRIVQAAAALHLFCPQPFFKKTIRPNFPALLCVLLSCQSHPHEPRGADWPDRHLLHSGPGVNSSSSLPHAAATSFSCVKDEDRLTLQAWSSQTPHLKAAETSDQTANITEWWRENLEILSFSIIYIFVHNTSWFVQNCSTSNCWEKVWICFHTEVKYSWKYSVLQVVDKKKKTLHNNVPILLLYRFMLNKNELKVNDTHVYSFNS